MNTADFALLYNPSTGFRLGAISTPPSLSPTDVLVRPLWVGICGSDLFSLRNSNPGDVGFGHEWVGVIDACGGATRGVSAGNLVTSTAFIGCGSCTYCNLRLPNLCGNATILGREFGAARSWLMLPFWAVVNLPSVDPAAAVLFEIAAVAEETLSRIPQCMETTTFLAVIGAGPVGLMVGLLSLADGRMPLLVEREPSRRAIAQRLGLNAIAPAEFLLHAMEHPFSVVIDCSGDFRAGRGVWEYIPDCITKRGLVIMVAKYQNNIVFCADALGRKSATLIWVRGASHDSLLSASTRRGDLIQKSAGVILSHRIPVAEAGRAIALAEDAAHSCKVLLSMPRQFE